MELYEILKTYLNIDIVIVALVILSGFFQEKYLCKFNWSKDPNYDATIKTFVVSIIVCTLYIILIFRQSKREAIDGVVVVPYVKYFISYFTATSLYDLVIKPIRNWISKTSKSRDDKL